MRTIVIGDIHGHINSVEAALGMPCNVVFVGDYLDSFHQSVENQVRCLTMVMDAVEAEPDRVVALLGNHEQSYLDTHMRCSGYKLETANHVVHLKDRMLSVLKDYHWLDGILISHAGVDQEILDWDEITVDEYLKQGNFKQIGNARGGYSKVGGLYWNDFNLEMEPVNGLVQVVGHSNWRVAGDPEGVRSKLSEDGTGEVWCVDNLNRVAEVLMIDEAGCRPFPLGGELDE